MVATRAAMLALALGLATTLHAAPPTTQPDLSSPRSALLTVYSTMRAGDTEALKACLLFDDVAAADVFDIGIAQVCTPLRLMHAMEAKFGPAGRKPFDPSIEKTIDEAIARVQRAEFTVTGDKAVVAEKKAAVNPDAETELSGLTLRQAAGQWKVVASTFPENEASTADVEPKQLALMRSLRDAQVQACQTTLDRLNKGEFQTPEQAYAAYQSLLQPTARAAAKSAPPPPAPTATSPATH